MFPPFPVWLPSKTIPRPEKPTTASPSIVELPAWTTRPSQGEPSFVHTLPSRTTSGGSIPGWERPLITTGLVIGGSGVDGVIVTTPLPIAKSISAGTGAAFAWVIASRRVPAPESAFDVTVIVPANACGVRTAPTRATTATAIKRAARPRRPLAPAGLRSPIPPAT